MTHNLTHDGRMTLSQSADIDPPEIREAWALDPSKVYAVAVNRHPLTREDADSIRQAFDRHGIRVIVYPADMLTIREDIPPGQETPDA